MASHSSCHICHREKHSNNIAYINCGHSFCKYCIETEAGKQAICPICKQKFDEFGADPPKEKKCVICQDTIHGRCGFLPCGHSFCYHCIFQWIQESRSCPICKMECDEIFQTPPINSEDPFPSVEDTPDSLPRIISLDAGLDPGNEKVHGHFSCRCGRKWQSSNAYEGVWQKCVACRRYVIPSRVAPLGQIGLSEGTHRKELCGMCRQMGRDCSSEQKFTQADLSNFCASNRTYTN